MVGWDSDRDVCDVVVREVRYGHLWQGKRRWKGFT